MNNEEPERLMTKGHEKMLDIAKAAEIFSWIALGFSVIGGWLEYSKISNNYFFNTELGFSKDLLTYVTENPFAGVNVCVDLLSVVIKWIILFLILRGLGLGLRMIVETDMNYRLKNVGESENE